MYLLCGLIKLAFCLFKKYKNKILWYELGVIIHITLFRAIPVFCGTNSIMWNISHIQFECENILQDVVSPAEHCYDYE
jgi:hypothetical protein